MKAIFLFDLQSYFKHWSFYLILVFIVSFGLFGGQNARFSISDAVFQNSPYQISFIVSFVSLTTIFFSTIFASQLLLKEIDNRFELLYFSAPITKKQFVFGRYFSLLLITFLLVLLFTVSFLLGQSTNSTAYNNDQFVISHYVFPLVFFSLINTFFTTAFLSFVGWFSKSKMMIYVSGLLLYILYMVSLVFSSSPFMAQSLPQSELTKFISAILDPFGLSAFFNQTSQWSVAQRNSELISLDGVFMVNRLMVLGISLLFLFFCVKKYSFVKNNESKKHKQPVISEEFNSKEVFRFVDTSHDLKSQFSALLSYVKINLIYIFKSIPFVLTLLIILFAVGMEMYAEIEKGIRIPQKYATSGLMVSTIIQNFYYFGIIAVLYYSHDVFWRSTTANFNLIEDSTVNTKVGFFAKWISVSILIFVFSGFLILEGIIFQIAYNYANINYCVYAKVILFATFPLILLCGFVFVIQRIINQKYIALGVTGLFAFIMATSVGKKPITYPLLRFLHTISFDYSDMNGFGKYQSVFLQRLIFGFCILILLLLLLHLTKKNFKKWYLVMLFILISFLSFKIGSNLMEGYQYKDEDIELRNQANYEKLYRKHQNQPQPTIVDVKTTVNLFPNENKYDIKGIYVLENKTAQNIDEILVNFADGFIINKAIYRNGNEKISIKNQYQVIKLKQVLLPNQKANFEFDLSYAWKAVNGHKSFNAIIENGSFMRISRYYPQFGYDSGNEIQDETIRKQFQLGKITAPKSFTAPKSLNNDFINLDMIISTKSDQIAIGVGDLEKEWKSDNRNYFQYKTSLPIPFRFGVSSAEYAVIKEVYKGKSFEIYYHSKHSENVCHLIKNAKLTMDYCNANFGNYPFKTIRFAEISSFTKGFAATAYPATIFMAEDVIFHSNIKADEQQDVINELAGHELSHLWWGNNQINPDDRDGSAMLTETLAMYTEMMLIKKMYGKQKMLERIQMHLDIYNNERGFTEEQPLYKVKDENAHVSYSKGAVVMYLLSELIGEKKVNIALHNFLEKNKYPNPKPISTDLIIEFYKVTDIKYHERIKELFTKLPKLKLK